MSIQSFSQPRIKFLDPLRFDSPYRFPIFAVTMPLGFWIGKHVARYVRDHNFNQLAHSNRLVIRNAYRIYNYLFPSGSGRRYFMEVALLDNFLSALHMEVHLHTMPYPIPREGSNIEEVILSAARVCFLAYFIDKIRLVVYQTLRWVPCNRVTSFAFNLAPTGIYHFRIPNEEIFEYRN